MVEQVSLIIAYMSINVLTHQTVKYFPIKTAGVMGELQATQQSPLNRRSRRLVQGVLMRPSWLIILIYKYVISKSQIEV